MMKIKFINIFINFGDRFVKTISQCLNENVFRNQLVVVLKSKIILVENELQLNSHLYT